MTYDAAAVAPPVKVATKPLAVKVGLMLPSWVFVVAVTGWVLIIGVAEVPVCISELGLV